MTNEPTAEQIAEVKRFLLGGEFQTESVWSADEMAQRGSQSARHLAENAELTAKWQARLAAKRSA